MLTEPASSEKRLLRASALARRDALASGQREDAAHTVAARDFRLAIDSNVVAAGYAPIRSEFDPGPLMLALAARGAQLALPCVIAPDQPLMFRAWTPQAVTSRNRYGIAEPAGDVPAVNPDIVLVPLAAFDRAGHRIGYGAGYYDRTLAALRARRPVIAIGLAFSVQEVAQIPSAPHDAPVDYVLTEIETIHCRS